VTNSQKNSHFLLLEACNSLSVIILFHLLIKRFITPIT